MARRIIIIEDDPAIRENYIAVLKKQGYDAIGYSNRQDTLQACKTRLPDLAVIDIGLGHEPDGGFTLCRELRALSAKLPIIFLTARDSDFDVVSGLRMGADDYLTKDASLPHLLARISALFRRSDLQNSPSEVEDLIERGPLKLDMKRFTVSWKNKPIELTLTELWMLHAMVKFPGHVKDREQLMQEANMVVDDSTITSHIKRMRKKFIEIDSSFNCIDTVYGMGYRWNAD